MTSKEACPVLSLHTLWRFFERYYILIGFFMILLGLFLMILGGKYFKVTMFLAGQWSVCALIMIIMFAAVYPKDSPLWVVWLTLFISLGFGSGFGYAAAKWARVG